MTSDEEQRLQDRADSNLLIVYGALLAVGAALALTAGFTTDRLSLMLLAGTIALSGIALMRWSRSRTFLVIGCCVVAIGPSILHLGSDSIARTSAIGGLSAIAFFVLLVGRAGKWRWWFSVAFMLVLSGAQLRHGYLVWRNPLPDGYRPIELSFVMVDDETNWITDVREEELPDGWSFGAEPVSPLGRAFTQAAYLKIVVSRGREVDALRADALAWLKAAVRIPNDRRFAWKLVKTSPHDAGYLKSYLLSGEVLLGNRDVREAKLVQPDGDGVWSVALWFTDMGLEKFERISTKHHGRRIAILFEQSVGLAPRLEVPITRNPLKLTMSPSATEWETQLLVDGLNRNLYAPR